jgi:hypothetical protein
VKPYAIGRQPLLERQPLVLLGLLRGGRDLGQLNNGLGVLPRLLGQLLDVAPVLELPGGDPALRQLPGTGFLSQ